MGEFPLSDDKESVKVIYDLPILAPQSDQSEVSNTGQVDVPIELLQSESENQSTTSEPDQPGINT